MFRSLNIFPEITHITDAMGVSFTLIAGTERALLVDAGYGTEDVAAYVRTLTDRPVTVLLTHGHHDHVLGARWFPAAWMCEEDLPVFRLRTASAQRQSVRQQAYSAGVAVPEDYLSAPIPDPEPLQYNGELAGFSCRTLSLGNLDVRIVRVPGHTPGSCMVIVPRYSLLLTGDNWNPCTWMWFAESAPVQAWRNDMNRFLLESAQVYGDFPEYILCSHQSAPRAGNELKTFLSYMTDDRLRAAPPVEMNSPIHTCAVTLPERDWTLLFDAGKLSSV